MAVNTLETIIPTNHNLRNYLVITKCWCVLPKERRMSESYWTHTTKAEQFRQTLFTAIAGVRIGWLFEKNSITSNISRLHFYSIIFTTRDTCECRVRR